MSAALATRQNRSSEELEMRVAVEAWGRARWPDARVVHELVTGSCRIDMAFVRPEHLIGVEIKSSADTLKRLDKQLKTFTRILPEVWLAFAPKWLPHVWDDIGLTERSIPFSVGQLLIDGGCVETRIPFRHRPGQGMARDARPDVMITTPLLHLLWRDEAKAIADRMRVVCSPREPAYKLIKLLARQLTGNEILREVCRELRGRAAFATGSDAPSAPSPEQRDEP